MNLVTVPISGYRAGDLDSPRGLFFVDSYGGAWLYAHHSGKPVVAYRLAVSDVFVVANQYAWLAAKLGKPVEAIAAEKALSNDPHWLRNLDKCLLDEAASQGFDAVRYTRPTTPNARWEMAVFSAKNCQRLGECDDNGNIVTGRSSRRASP